LKQPQRAILLDDDVDAVRDAVASLPDRLRDVLVEVCFRGRSVVEAAHILALSPDTVRSDMFNALLAFHERLIAAGLLPHRGAH
jgi:RNA polymerase sigma-70 factor (ECF subfamily)